jgi:uncharacterized protein
MKILITGATGLVGKEITDLLLQNGIKVNYLTTSKNKIQHQPNFNGFYWNPAAGIIDEACLIGVTAIIHLAGASISKRWTNAYKQEIIESRVLSANLLFNALKNNTHQVEQFVSASAIGVYPSSIATIYNENFQDFNNSFLSNVVLKWEDAVNQIERLDIAVCKLRLGLVLSTQGGALAEILKPTRLGFGAAFGSGKQMQSWIHIHDLANMFLFALEKGLQGVYNAVAPIPVSNQELSKEVALTLGKPFFMPNIPKFIMRLVLGEMHTLLFESQNVSSKKIEKEGFEFQFKTIHTCLNDLLLKK